MTDNGEDLPEETLDPENWDAVRELGHRMLDDMIDYVRSAREHAHWKHAPEAVREHFSAPLPLDPQPLGEVYDEFRSYVLPYPVGNIHPRFWGWVIGTGTIDGALAEWLASAMNTNTGGVDYHSANYVENQVIHWCKKMLGFPEESSGLLTSGCSSANLIGLAVARNARAGFDIREKGVQESPRRMVLYGSAETHSSIQKAVELLGLGGTALRFIPINDLFQINLQVLKTAVRQDRDRGYLPFCVIGTAGTTNTGSVDDLTGLADFCQDEGLWFHVDGAFGAWAALAPRAKTLVSGMERADSLAFDLHKWMYMPYEIACVLVRHKEVHRSAFSLTPHYLSHGEGGRGMTGGDLPWFSDYGFQLSRGFRALKAWMSLKTHGVRKYGKLIQQNIDQALFLATLVENTPALELMAPVALNVVCYRYRGSGLDDDTLNDVNRRILVEMQEQGIAAPSGTSLKGIYVIHVAITNHRSTSGDFVALVEETVRLGDTLSRST
jgi:glutamate/tyrosine decarboxylase-like PLP-dependent enzyme